MKRHKELKNLPKLSFLKNIYLCLVVMFICLLNTNAYGEYRYFSINLNGSYFQSTTEYSLKKRTSYGSELTIPLTDFLEVSYAYTLTDDVDYLNEKYRADIKSKGVDIPDDQKLIRRVTTQDQSLDVGLGFQLGLIRPSLFGGALWRVTCFEDWYADFGCNNSGKPTWNAGINVTTFITQRLRFKVTFRISPVSIENAKPKTYDRSLSVGLSWGI